MIKSFINKETSRLFRGEYARHLPHDLQRIALRKLIMIDEARNLRDLRSVPGNRLEELKGNYRGYHSIRINDQWRICFLWQNNNAHSVGIIDYH